MYVLFKVANSGPRLTCNDPRLPGGALWRLQSHKNNMMECFITQSCQGDALGSSHGGVERLHQSRVDVSIRHCILLLDRGSGVLVLVLPHHLHSAGQLRGCVELGGRSPREGAPLLWPHAVAIKRGAVRTDEVGVDGAHPWRGVWCSSHLHVLLHAGHVPCKITYFIWWVCP